MSVLWGALAWSSMGFAWWTRTAFDAECREYMQTKHPPQIVLLVVVVSSIVFGPILWLPNRFWGIK